MFVVIGEGPNGLEIPLVFFTTKEAAEEFIKQFPVNEQYPTHLSDDFSETRGEFDTDEPHPLYKKLFAGGHYYSGCGGCGRLSVRPIVEGAPIVGWDLD